MSASPSDSALLKQLSANSEPYRDPLSVLPWQALSFDDFWLPPCALSLAGDPQFAQRSLATQKRLSQYEFINFIQAGLWLEGIFIQRLGKSLRPCGNLVEYAYALHEIREEAGHSLMFLKLVELSGLHLPVACMHPPRFADFLGRHAPTGSGLFRLAVVIGEDIPDRMNRLVRAHAGEINPLTREMCRLHIIDEARHMARARQKLETHLPTESAPQATWLRPLLSILIKQFVRRFYFPPAAVYDLAGLKPGPKWQARAQSNGTRQAFLLQLLQPTLHLLAQHGIRLQHVF